VARKALRVSWPTLRARRRRSARLQHSRSTFLVYIPTFAQNNTRRRSCDRPTPSGDRIGLEPCSSVAPVAGPAGRPIRRPAGTGIVAALPDHRYDLSALSWR